MHKGFRWRNLRERDHLEDPGIDGRIIIRWIFRRWGVVLWTGLIYSIANTNTCTLSLVKIYLKHLKNSYMFRSVTFRQL